MAPPTTTTTTIIVIHTFLYCCKVATSEAVAEEVRSRQSYEAGETGEV